MAPLCVNARILLWLSLGIPLALTVTPRLSPGADPRPGRLRFPSVRVQAPAAKDLAAGKFLVARRDLADPNFTETVVLLIHYDEEAAMGVIVNRRTRLPISRVLQEIKEAKGRSDPVYAGGPVSRTDVQVLLRSRTKPDPSIKVLGDVYMISARSLLEKALGAGTETSALRVYLGYAGWGPGQLEHEIELSSWFVLPGNADMVFDPRPESVWQRLIQRTELQVATALARPAWSTN